jgi:hypothetical protein
MKSHTIKVARAAATGESHDTGRLPDRLRRHHQRAVTMASGKDKAARRSNRKRELRRELRRGEW